MVDGRWISTTFAFCFEMREGMLLLSGFNLFSAFFWIFSSSYMTTRWPEDGVERSLTLVSLLASAALGYVAASTANEQCARALVVSFGTLACLLFASFGSTHPLNCENNMVANDTPLGAPRFAPRRTHVSPRLAGSFGQRNRAKQRRMSPRTPLSHQLQASR